jgi:nucleoside-diphosphate-sugar epimerase
VLISSCSCYQKPPRDFRIDERTPLENPFWPYARLKIACEEVALRAGRERGVPVTIVRPSLTYGDSRIPGAYHNSAHSWTTAARMLSGKPVIVHGDGTGLWQVTHAADFAKGFVAVLGRKETHGEAYNITTDEVLTWDRIVVTLAETLGVQAKLVHVATDFIAKFDPARAEGLYGDKCHSVVIDNTKIKRLSPGFAATIPLREGLKRTIEWFRADPARQTVDAAFDALVDRIIAANGAS